MAERPWDYSVIEAWSRCLIDRACLAGITAKVGNCHLLFAQIVEQKLKQRQRWTASNAFMSCFSKGLQAGIFYMRSHERVVCLGLNILAHAS